MDFSILGKRIRDERLLLRMTIEQLAEKVEKSSNFIGQIERGDRKASLETIADIATALGTTIDDLLEDNINKHEDHLIREINALLYSSGETEKRFILDVIKRYNYYHKHE